MKLIQLIPTQALRAATQGTWNALTSFVEGIVYALHSESGTMWMAKANCTVLSRRCVRAAKELSKKAQAEKEDAYWLEVGRRIEERERIAAEGKRKREEAKARAAQISEWREKANKYDEFAKIGFVRNYYTYVQQNLFIDARPICEHVDITPDLTRGLERPVPVPEFVAWPFKTCFWYVLIIFLAIAFLIFLAAVVYLLGIIAFRPNRAGRKKGNDAFSYLDASTDPIPPPCVTLCVGSDTMYDSAVTERKQTTFTDVSMQTASLPLTSTSSTAAQTLNMLPPPTLTSDYGTASTDQASSS